MRRGCGRSIATRRVLDSLRVVLLLSALLGGWVLMRRTARRAQAQQQAAEATGEGCLEMLADVILRFDVDDHAGGRLRPRHRWVRARPARGGGDVYHAALAQPAPCS
ncbi:MAG TPA: hypothetical protein VFR53_00435 [Methylomirabilota bacterium]|nr:hypothetical protein [Methylomirabilota bacterium]